MFYDRHSRNLDTSSFVVFWPPHCVNYRLCVGFNRCVQQEIEREVKSSTMLLWVNSKASCVINESFFFGLEIEGKIEVSRFISIGNLYDEPRVPHRKAQLFTIRSSSSSPMCRGLEALWISENLFFVWWKYHWVQLFNILWHYDRKKNSDDSTHRNEIKEISRRTSKRKEKIRVNFRWSLELSGDFLLKFPLSLARSAMWLRGIEPRAADPLLGLRKYTQFSTQFHDVCFAWPVALFADWFRCCVHLYLSVCFFFRQKKSQAPHVGGSSSS